MQIGIFVGDIPFSTLYIIFNLVDLLLSRFCHIESDPPFPEITLK